VAAAGALIHYLRSTQKVDLAHVRAISYRQRADTLLVDPTTLKHLEIIEGSEGGREGSLWHEIDRTVTTMGGLRLPTYVPFAGPILAADLARRAGVQPIDGADAFSPTDRQAQRTRSRCRLERLVRAGGAPGRPGLGTWSASSNPRPDSTRPHGALADLRAPLLSRWSPRSTMSPTCAPTSSARFWTIRRAAARGRVHATGWTTSWTS
jgi:hypothetical protein